MATLLTRERPFVASALPTLSIRTVLATVRARRAQRKALASLMELDDRRLDDLGLSREDLLGAIRARPRSLGEVFAARRAQRASRSLSG